MRFWGQFVAALCVVAVLCAIGAPVAVTSFAKAGGGPNAQPSPREVISALHSLRVETQTYYVRDLDVRREGVRFFFTEGKLAFLTPAEGRVVGLVFTGRGRVLALPRDPVEKASLAKFLGAPLLDQPFTRAYIRFTDGTPEELTRALAGAGVKPSTEPSFAEEWNETVSNLNVWHSLRVMADWTAAQPRPYFYAGLLSEYLGPFDVMVDARREEQVIFGQPRYANNVRYYDVWAAFRTADEAFVPDFTPVSYSVETSIQPDRSLQGATWAEVRATRGGERMISLELSRHLKVDSATDAQGQPLTFLQNEELSEQQIAQRGNDVIHIILPRPAAAGEIMRLRVTYRGTVISDAGNGVYFVGDRGSWYPHIIGYHHFIPFELSFRWPRRLQLVATGKKLDEREEGEWKLARWKSEGPVPVAGFNLGEYATEQVENGKLRIDLYANRELESVMMQRFARASAPPRQPKGVYRPPGYPTPPPAPIINFPDPPPPSPAAVLKQLGNDVAEAVRFNEKMSGAFPFERLSVAQIPGSFGQGWPGLLYLSTLSFLPPSAQTRAGISQQTQEHFIEVMPSHEVAHQWWGNTVGWATYRDQWILEGLSNYLGLMYADSKRPDERQLAAWLERYRTDLLTHGPTGESVESAGPLTLGSRLRSSRSPFAYTNIIYGKGAWIFHMLRTMLRDATPGPKNPDARFQKLLASLMESHRHRALTTADFQRAVERVMTPAMALEGSKSMDWFFDQWVRGTGIPKYSVSFTVKPNAAGTAFTIRGKLKQENVPEYFTASVPIYVPRAIGRPLLLGHVITTGEETAFTFTAKSSPRKLAIDPNLTLLAITE